MTKKKENLTESKKCIFCGIFIYKSDKPNQYKLTKTCDNKDCKLKLHVEHLKETNGNLIYRNVDTFKQSAEKDD